MEMVPGTVMVKVIVARTVPGPDTVTDTVSGTVMIGGFYSWLKTLFSVVDMSTPDLVQGLFEETS